MPTQAEILNEINNRYSSLNDAQKSIVDELNSRLGTGQSQKSIVDELRPLPEKTNKPIPQLSSVDRTMAMPLKSRLDERIQAQKMADRPLKEEAAYLAEQAPVIGAMVGGIAAAPANILAPGVSEAIGAAAGYKIGEGIKRNLKIYAGKEKPKSALEELKIYGENIDEAGIVGMSGPVLEKATPLIAKPIMKVSGKLIKPILGRMSGLGAKSVTEAIESGVKGEGVFKSSTAFDKALRGEISGQDIVDSGKAALYELKNARGMAYNKKLADISKSQDALDPSPITDKAAKLIKQYNIKLKPDGKFDMSRVAMGKKGRKDIQEILERIMEHGSKEGDNTALGLDILKRQLDDFYSESSQARAFVTDLKNTVKKTITDNVPEYAEMTKGYAEATKMIKDIEAGLMLRKQGMTGRIYSDQTLRRLMSTMKSKFELRGELVDILGSQAAVDLSGQIAGYGMRSVLPVGLQGNAAALATEAAVIKYINPKFWPLVLASSPRVQGEFLRLFGKAITEAGKTASLLKTTGIVGAEMINKNIKRK